MLTLRTWIMRYLKAMIVPGLVLFASGAYFVVFDPLPSTTGDVVNSPLIAVVGALFISPLTFIIGFVVMRKLPESIIGTGIALWGFAVAIELSAPYSPPLFGAVGLLYIMSASFPGLFLMVTSFPTGRIITPLWERVMYSLVLVMIVSSVLSNLSLTTAYRSVSPSPLSIDALIPLSTFMSSLTTLLFSFAMVLSFALLIYRYRISGAQERKQLRWLALFGIYMFMDISMNLVFATGENDFYAKVIIPLNITILSYMPGISIGMAILRHHLFDIDIIIRRTLIYAILTAILAVVYFGGVILVQQLLRPFTQSSDLAIVVSTLVIAALFTPLRRRVQETIDRRLYRRKYDAERTLSGFNRTLRDEVDIDTLKAQLVGVVTDTMQPTKIALWVKD